MMAEEAKIDEIVEEINGASEEELKQVIETWFESTRTAGMKLGATYISAAIYGVIQKHIVKKEKASLRDFRRCVDEIVQIISVQLTQQNDSMEETSNDE